MLKAFANAKINLLLDILGREENGYHTVNNIMQTVSLQDTVTLSCKGEGIIVSYDDGYPVTDKDICLNAAKKYEKVSGRKINADIFINKVIPTAAGLGGNSSAAAAVLTLLNEKYAYLTHNQLLEIAATLGADVPFFLIGGTALCEHYGEIITPIPPMPKLYVVIAKIGDKDSTAEMYKKLDQIGTSKAADLDKMLSAIKSREAKNVFPLMQNVFEKVASKESLKLIQIIKDCGAEKAMLSGSGPAVFGMFYDEQGADGCCRTLCDMGISAYLCETTDKGIELE